MIEYVWQIFVGNAQAVVGDRKQHEFVGMLHTPRAFSA
jgi:hypothetical protein